MAGNQNQTGHCTPSANRGNWARLHDKVEPVCVLESSLIGLWADLAGALEEERAGEDA